MDWTMLLLKKIASSNNFGLVAASLIVGGAIVVSSLVGQVDEERIVGIEGRIGSIEERIVGIEKEIVELRVETKTEIAGLKEDVNRIDANLLRLESKIDAFIASQATGGRAGG